MPMREILQNCYGANYVTSLDLSGARMTLIGTKMAASRNDDVTKKLT